MPLIPIKCVLILLLGYKCFVNTSGMFTANMPTKPPPSILISPSPLPAQQLPISTSSLSNDSLCTSPPKANNKHSVNQSNDDIVIAFLAGYGHSKVRFHLLYFVSIQSNTISFNTINIILAYVNIYMFIKIPIRIKTKISLHTNTIRFDGR